MVMLCYVHNYIVVLCVLGRAARLLIHKEPIGKAVELLCTLIRADTTPVQLVTLLAQGSYEDWPVMPDCC